jgi:hypothetical protein
LLEKLIFAAKSPLDVACKVIGPGCPERPLMITWQSPL